MSMTGVISNGWGYVAAAWGISLALLLVYAVGVNLRLLRRSRKK